MHKLLAGRAAERMLLEEEPVAPGDDLRQARELAMLICTEALSIVLRIKRTLDGAEIDKIISDVQARKAVAIERGRRMQWRQVIENAATFVR
jgi:hypothetical protein